MRAGRGLERRDLEADVIEAVSIDEKSFQKGHRLRDYIKRPLCVDEC
jgi:hypothetical protein